MYHFTMYLHMYNLLHCTVPCVTLQKYFHLVLYVHIQDIIFVSWRYVQAFTKYDPLHIQIRQEYFIKLVKYKFQGGSGLYNLRSIIIHSKYFSDSDWLKAHA